MKKIIILIPVFNDWESLKKLLIEIENSIKKFPDLTIQCFVVNDASTIAKPEFKKPEKIDSLKILNMKENRGHARCNAFGIRYITQNEKFDYLILMDGDGEDRPSELEDLITKALENPNFSVVAKRVKRSEGLFFQSLYLMHKLITYFFTGKKINFGNYTCLTKKDAEIISSKPSLWSSYSGTVKKNLSNLIEVNSIRGVRYFGPSKMSLFKLIIHSFSIIAVFKFNVFLRSIFVILLLFLLKSNLGIFALVIISLLAIFNLMILIVSFREQKEDLLSSQANLKNITNILH